MKREMLGDSYDLVKRTLIELLRPLGQWAAHPMLTDEEEDGWIQQYEALLGVRAISTEVLTRDSERDSYFEPDGEAGYDHLLLDPNTGLVVGNNPRYQRSRDHILGTDLLRLCQRHPESLFMVFDQSLRRQRVDWMRQALQQKCCQLREQNLQAFAYSSHAFFVFVSGCESVSNWTYEVLLTSLPADRLVVPE